METSTSSCSSLRALPSARNEGIQDPMAKGVPPGDGHGQTSRGCLVGLPEVGVLQSICPHPQRVFSSCPWETKPRVALALQRGKHRAGPSAFGFFPSFLLAKKLGLPHPWQCPRPWSNLLSWKVALVELDELEGHRMVRKELKSGSHQLAVELTFVHELLMP